MATPVIHETQEPEMIGVRLASASTRVSGTAASALFTAIFFMAAGWGWNAGNFVQPANTTWGAWADTLHVVPLAILLPLSLRFMSALRAGNLSRGARNGITGLAIFGILGCSVMVALGIINPDPNSVGVHTFEDWMPVIVQNVGNLLWLGTLMLTR
jgi:hypothetical protein